MGNLEYMHLCFQHSGHSVIGGVGYCHEGYGNSFQPTNVVSFCECSPIIWPEININSCSEELDVGKSTAIALLLGAQCLLGAFGILLQSLLGGRLPDW